MCISIIGRIIVRKSNWLHRQIAKTKKALQDNCKMLEREARRQSVLPIAEQIIRLRIVISELLAFHTAVVCLPLSS